MKCNYCRRRASWSMKTMLYGNTFYKHICNYHFIEEGKLIFISKKNLGGENNAVIK